LNNNKASTYKEETTQNEFIYFGLFLNLYVFGDKDSELKRSENELSLPCYYSNVVFRHMAHPQRTEMKWK
jgi:hypothetical protein